MYFIRKSTKLGITIMDTEFGEPDMFIKKCQIPSLFTSVSVIGLKPTGNNSYSILTVADFAMDLFKRCGCKPRVVEVSGQDFLIVEDKVMSNELLFKNRNFSFNFKFWDAGHIAIPLGITTNVNAIYFALSQIKGE